MSKLGPILRRVRLLKNINQKDIAKRLNISNSQMNKIEFGVHEPTETNTLKILKFLLPDLNLDENLVKLENKLTSIEVEAEFLLKKLS